MKKVYLFIIAAILVISALSFVLLTGKDKRENQKSNDPVVKDMPCGMQNCHGLEISCGPNPVEMCDMMYQMGDNCRQYARCETIEGECRLIKDSKFEECKKCVEECLEKNSDPADQFSCESGCIGDVGSPE
jgi:hypothetical protein